jgi:hypothetical protein
LRESFPGWPGQEADLGQQLVGLARSLVEGFPTLLRDGIAVAEDGIRIRRTLPDGHATGVLSPSGRSASTGCSARRSTSTWCPWHLDRSRLISPASKLAARARSGRRDCGLLGRLLELGVVDEVKLCRGHDWLGARQAAFETALARRHLKDGALVLYDVSSSWLEGRCCEFARLGYSLDGKKDKLQTVYGLLCAADGCPVAIEVFEGNTRRLTQYA